ncbi:NYN domain-containing protein [Alkalinema pantanalense CENA528]|uniref:NYN domain-containing protein n=1 Tax=Alkalinema pantanalense TaxID=1620705 RepID=UPI003D6E803E
MSKRPAPQAILLVDGYNIVGAWRDLKKIRDRQGLEEARRHLTELMAGFAAYNAYDTQLVFDAQYRNSPSNREIITRFLSIHYTDQGQTADTYIEKSCADFRYDIRKFHQRIIVATNDRAQQLTVVGYGAEWMSAEQLANEVEFTISHVRRKQKPTQKSSGRFLINSLDPEAQAKLDRLRYGK